MSATLVSLVIQDRRPFADGEPFGDSGPYERVRGRAHLRVDPGDPNNTGVTDLERAERGGDGRVACSTDICILRPTAPAAGNRRLLFDWANRGNKRALQMFNDAPPGNAPLARADAGNGFLFRRGYSVAWAAWQGDVLPGDGRLLLDTPVARDDGAAPLTGPARAELIADRNGITTLPLSGNVATRSHPAVSLDPADAHLTRRRYPWSTPEAVPPGQWCFAREERGTGVDGRTAETALVPSATHIHMPGGFAPGWIHELVYRARDPLVLGLGLVAVRDVIDWLRHADADADGNPNPLAGTIDRAYAWGRSQAGRAVREFVYLGLNAAPTGRRVFDGVMPHVAGAGRLWLNQRFANGYAVAGQQYEGHHNPADRFPFAYAATTDHVTGRRDAILKRPESDPLVLHTQSASEYWQRRGSLVHTDTHGEDLPQPDGVRLYLWASSDHFGRPGDDPATAGPYRYPENVVATAMLARALLDALDRWASDGTEPPASRVPRRADGTLVGADEWRAQFPAIPGVVLPTGPNPLPLLDFGPQAEAGVFTREPPAVRAASAYPVRVPAVDADGNEVAGVRAPPVAAPLGTYTGWNLRRPGFGDGAMYEFTGSYLPFADSPEERAVTGDPRPAVLERYRDADDYARAIEAAARALVDAGLMLEEDVARAVAAARDWGRPRHAVALPGADGRPPA